MPYRKKLIEVALPLDAINAESAREKSIRHGHPSTMHIWWARRPLAACRAVIFASLVDDPSVHQDRFPTEEAQEAERQRLFRIIEQLVKWENTNNQAVLDIARREIEKTTDGNLPSLLDPFCGGGSIPLEAQRLGLVAHASDLNPVPVLITKAMVEIPPIFSGKPPINPENQTGVGAGTGWIAARGLAEDVRYYGQWMRDEAEKRLSHLYPKVRLPKEQGGGEATVIAWLWARTVKCPNPACQAEMPLVRSFVLSAKPGKRVWISPIVDRAAKRVQFHVETGTGSPPDGTVKQRSVTCLVCNTVSMLPYVRAEAHAGRMKTVPLAIVAEGKKEIVYISPNEEHEAVAHSAQPKWKPEEKVTTPCHDVDRLPMYGMFTWGDAFTPRQLTALTTFSDLVSEAREQIVLDGMMAGLPNDDIPLEEGGTGARAYADAVATYLAFAVDRSANYWSSLTPWGGSFIVQTFGRQALAMVWDFAEGNPLSNTTGNWLGAIEWITRCLQATIPANRPGTANQCDATVIDKAGIGSIVCTDPPYYDNVGYADLSDFFYVWLRHSLSKVYPSLFGTLLTPKAQELIAAPYRFGGNREKARRFFEEGLSKSFAQMRKVQHPDYPLTVFYAFKQAEVDQDDDNQSTSVVASTGWETMLQGLLDAGFTITGTWPMRTERDQGLKTGTNVLASSIVLVCRPRPLEAGITTRREFLNTLKRELPNALKNLQHGNIAPVDLAQATIGPGMAVFSRYGKVLEADGSAMRVRTALQLINQALDEVLTEQEGEFDADTRWAVAWFEQFGMQEAPFGQAETLSKAKNTSVGGLKQAGIVTDRLGKVRLLARDELSADWDPSVDKRLTVWEVTQHLIRALDREGEAGAAALLRRVGAVGEVARDLAYRLYTVCERKKWADEALAYNSLVTSWPQITQLANQQAAATPRQQELFT